MPAEMGDDWPELCQDEVYVQECVPLDRIIGVAVHPADAESILAELLHEFQRLALPLYDYGGKVVWPHNGSGAAALGGELPPQPVTEPPRLR